MSSGDFYSVTLANILTWIIPVLTLGGFIWRLMNWNKNRIQESTDQRTQAISKQIQEANVVLCKKLDDLDKKSAEMLQDLKIRADLTNGNVKKIRMDIADIQDELDLIPRDDREESETVSARRNKRRSKRRDIEANNKNNQN